MLFETDRLYIRLWHEDDLQACFDMYSDMDVMRYLGSTPSTIDSLEEMKDRLDKRLELQQTWPVGEGMWAVVRKEDDQLLGAVIFRAIPNSKNIEPTSETEIGWHFAKQYWGNGYATEAAKATLDYGFENRPDLNEVVAICYDANEPSKRVMERLGMKFVGTTDRFYDIEACCYTKNREVPC